MNKPVIERKFAEMGARVEINKIVNPRQDSDGISINIRTDEYGEKFTIGLDEGFDPEAVIMDVDKKEKHLLMMVRIPEEPHNRNNGKGYRNAKYLCGHDERHWFVCGVPEAAGASSVRDAREALKPAGVIEAEKRAGLKTKDKNKRHNSADKRQGEWFFVPVNIEEPPEDYMLLKNEPIQRTGSSPHIVQEVYRRGGQVVFTHRSHPDGVSKAKMDEIVEYAVKKHQIGMTSGWVERRVNAQVFARGTVKHGDHATINLDGWHEVFMNTESQSWAGRNVQFID
ncbi:MAG: hypothetical protein KAS32_05260 [Candidatus Peribacteraceae bacterium]|nr:hypothetical protein [Candidatus Peribacteraceae bacterium]